MGFVGWSFKVIRALIFHFQAQRFSLPAVGFWHLWDRFHLRVANQHHQINFSSCSFLLHFTDLHHQHLCFLCFLRWPFTFVSVLAVDLIPFDWLLVLFQTHHFRFSFLSHAGEFWLVIFILPVVFLKSIFFVNFLNYS